MTATEKCVIGFVEWNAMQFSISQCTNVINILPSFANCQRNINEDILVGLWTTHDTSYEKNVITCLFVCLFHCLNHIQLQWIYKTIGTPNANERKRAYKYIFLWCIEDDRIIFIKWVLIFHIFLIVMPSQPIHSFILFTFTFQLVLRRRFIIENIVKPQVVEREREK